MVQIIILVKQSSSYLHNIYNKCWYYYELQELQAAC